LALDLNTVGSFFIWVNDWSLGADPGRSVRQGVGWPWSRDLDWDGWRGGRQPLRWRYKKM